MKIRPFELPAVRTIGNRPCLAAQDVEEFSPELRVWVKTHCERSDIADVWLLPIPVDLTIELPDRW